MLNKDGFPQKVDGDVFALEGTVELSVHKPPGWPPLPFFLHFVATGGVLRLGALRGVERRAESFVVKKKNQGVCKDNGKRWRANGVLSLFLC